MKQASLPSTIAEAALGREKECVFTGVSRTSDSDTLVATWVFPPSLGYTVSTNDLCVIMPDDFLRTAI